MMMGRRLEATLAPDLILPTIVQSVAEALKLPYAAIALYTDDRRPTTTTHHRRSLVVSRWSSPRKASGTPILPRAWFSAPRLFALMSRIF